MTDLLSMADQMSNFVSRMSRLAVIVIFGTVIISTAGLTLPTLVRTETVVVDRTKSPMELMFEQNNAAQKRLRECQSEERDAYNAWHDDDAETTSEIDTQQSDPKGPCTI